MEKDKDFLNAYMCPTLSIHNLFHSYNPPLFILQVADLGAKTFPELPMVLLPVDFKADIWTRIQLVPRLILFPLHHTDSAPTSNPNSGMVSSCSHN